MLLNKRQTKASDAELEAMIEEIRRELERREMNRKEEERRPKADESNEEETGGRGGYQWEMVRCRGKESKHGPCKCNGEKGHGPYLYRYFRKGGKMASEYIKLKELEDHPLAPPRPEPDDAQQLKPLPDEDSEVVVFS